MASSSIDMTIDITTTWRHSGGPCRIEIWFLNVDGVLSITGTADHNTKEQPKADYPQGPRNRHAFVWKKGFENAASGDE